MKHKTTTTTMTCGQNNEEAALFSEHHLKMQLIQLKC